MAIIIVHTAPYARSGEAILSGCLMKTLGGALYLLVVEAYL